MKVALVHDYLIEFGGAERVLWTLHQLWPEAPIYTAFYRSRNFYHVDQGLSDWKIIPSFWNRFPLIDKLISPLRFVAPFYFESLNLGDYDLVISSCNIYSAKSIITRPGTVHICYLHTPPRALYGYDVQVGWRRSFWKRLLAEPLTLCLRVHDFLSAQRANVLLANSQITQARITKFYRRLSRVVYPPVRSREIVLKTKRLGRREGDYYLTLGRFLPPKRLDLAIEACNKLHLPLVVIGSGREESRLRRLAGESIRFLENVPDDKLWEMYSAAKAVIFTAEDEDFGIIPVEAMAAGKPVIALRQGGVQETVVEGETGLFFEKPKVDDLVDLLKSFDPGQFDPKKCQRQALNFDERVFKKRIKEIVKEVTGCR